MQLDGVTACFGGQVESQGMLRFLGNQPQAMQVDILHVQIQFAVHIVAVQAEVGVHLHPKQGIVAVQPHRSDRCLQRRPQIDIRQAETTVLQASQSQVHLRGGAGRSQVEALPLSPQPGRQGV